MACLLIAQLTLELAPSRHCLFWQFLSKQTNASHNSYYQALGNGLVTDETRIFGDRTVRAYVTLNKNSSCHLFFSTVTPIALHMSIIWQDSKVLHDTSFKAMTFPRPSSISSAGTLRRITIL